MPTPPDRSCTFLRWYLIALFIAVIVLLVRWPIIAIDTDLWFHLDYGRYIAQHLAVPTSTYFSFLTPERPIIEHAWLFDLLLYQVYQVFGYTGLVLLRTIVFAGTAWVLARWLMDGAAKRGMYVRAVALTILCGVLLLMRDQLIRPHMFTYLYMVSLLWILDTKPRWKWLLPGLAALWCNMHGTTFVLILVIAMAYAIEFLVERGLGWQEATTESSRFLLVLILSMAMIYATPNGLRLLKVFYPTKGYAWQFVEELRPPTLEQLLSFQMLTLVPTYKTLYNVWLIVAVSALLIGLWRRQCRLSHLLLVAAGTALVSRGSRFMTECVVLSLPLVRAQLLAYGGSPQRRPWSAIRVTCAVFLMLIPVRFLQHMWADRPAYPYSRRGLPEGIVHFLQTHHVNQAKLLNYPGKGGFYRWELYPNVRVFTDMEFPGLPDEDFYLSMHVFIDPVVLERVLAQYDPSFIAVPFQVAAFQTHIARFPDFIPVFFDDAEILYVNRRHYPLLADEYSLADVDLFALVSRDIQTLRLELEGEPITKHLARLIAIDPACGTTRHLAGLLYMKEGAYDRVVPHAQTIIDTYPETVTGYVLMGQALLGLGHPERAIGMYRAALARTSDPETYRQVNRELGGAYQASGRLGAAYRALRESIDVFAPGASLEELERLGEAAVGAGEQDHATTIFRFMYEYKIPNGDADWLVRVRRQLERLGVDVDALEAEPPKGLTGALSEAGASK